MEYNGTVTFVFSERQSQEVLLWNAVNRRVREISKAEPFIVARITHKHLCTDVTIYTFVLSCQGFDGWSMNSLCAKSEFLRNWRYALRLYGGSVTGDANHSALCNANHGC